MNDTSNAYLENSKYDSWTDETLKLRDIFQSANVQIYALSNVPTMNGRGNLMPVMEVGKTFPNLPPSNKLQPVFEKPQNSNRLKYPKPGRSKEQRC